MTGRSSVDFCCRVCHCHHACRPFTYPRASHNARRCLRVLAQVERCIFDGCVDGCVLQRLAARSRSGIAPLGRRFFHADATRLVPICPVLLEAIGGPEHRRTLLSLKLCVRPSSPACRLARALYLTHADRRLFVLCRSYQVAVSAGSCSLASASTISTTVALSPFRQSASLAKTRLGDARCCSCGRVGGER